jgi:hypothetical protein
MMLRGGNIPARTAGCRHGYLTERLYADVLESEFLFNARLARMTSWAAMHGHPDADIGEVGRMLRMHYIDALASIPYITGGQTGEGTIAQERQKLVDRFKRYKDAILQGRQIPEKRDRMAGITKVKTAKPKTST